MQEKNLFVRDDKKRNYYLITVKGEKWEINSSCHLKVVGFDGKRKDLIYEQTANLRLFTENSIWHEITENKAVYNMAELCRVPCPYPEADAKNLFVRDDETELLSDYGKR